MGGECVVADAVRCEPVSPRISLFSREKQGKSAKYQTRTGLLRGFPPMIQWLVDKFPTQTNREFFEAPIQQ
jgi:hypothetical protein